MPVCKCVVNRHVVEEWQDMPLEESFNHCEVETRINKYGTEISFKHVGKTLYSMSMWIMPMINRDLTFGESDVESQ